MHFKVEAPPPAQCAQSRVWPAEGVVKQLVFKYDPAIYNIFCL